MKTRKKKLALNRETVRQLSGETLHGVAGGAINLSRASCQCPQTGTCPTTSAVNTVCACP